MKIRCTLLGIIVLVALSFTGFAQSALPSNPPDMANYPYWIDMMQDPSVNFFDVQNAFNTYWKDRPVTRSSGFKPFKRWEYMMQESRIFPDGTRRPADHIYNEYMKYIQTHPDARSENGNWTNLGPFVLPDGKNYKGLGRLNAIAFDPEDPDIIWVGSPSGGLWKTVTGGNNWTSSTDNLPSLGVSSILIDYTDADVMYIGTGDRDAGDAEGMGVFRSTDGGETWEPWKTGMGNRVVGRLLMHPSNHLIILAATNAGIYKTTDGGANWLLVKSGDFKDVVFKPGSTTIVYGAASGNFYRSTNTGSTFVQVTNGLPGAARGAIAVTPADPEIVYFFLTTDTEYKGLYRSTDGGLNFTMRSNSPNIMSWDCAGGSGGQAWYDLDVTADPENANVIFGGGVNCFKSTNGGTTWAISSHWWGDCSVPAVHADLHVLEYNPVDGKLYAGNDGGIYWTADGGTNWNLISNGLPISQVYKIGQSATVRDKVLNGYQDNGTSTYLGSHWQFTLGGDGMECAVDNKDAAWSYATLYYGSISRYYNNGYNADVAGNGIYGIDESGSWITPFLLDEKDPGIMFVGFKNIWRCDNVKAPTNQIQWTRISYNLGGSNSQDLRALEQSTANTDILYASRYDNRFFRTNDAHAASPSWVDLTSLLPENAGINDLECHPTDPDIVYMAQNNKIYKSTDQGMSWQNITGTLPDVAYTSISYYKNSHEGLYVTSNVGVFYKDKFMSDWVMFSNGLPVDASISEGEIWYDPDSAQNDVIRVGTYGRGMWESDMYHTQPDVNFYASKTLIPPGCSVDFTDMTSGVPTAWTWTFEGANQATSTDRNPSGIQYDTAGIYQVKLVASNEAGLDSLVKTEYITVSSSILPEANFNSDQKIICINGIVHFYDSTLYCPDSWQWSFDPITVAFHDGTNANSQNPVVEFRQPEDYTVTLIVSNTNGLDTLIKTAYIHSGGFSLPFSEDFESGTLAANSWTVVNPDNGPTWATYNIAETGNTTVRLKFYGYYKMQERDQLISTYLNFSNLTDAYLSFDHAYAQRFSQKDSLIIYVASGCQDDWTRVFAGGPDGNGIFETAPPTPYEFIPLSQDEWCGSGWGADCFTIDLTPWAGQNDVRIRFESYNNLGNDLYIDNILVSSTTGTPEVVQTTGKLAIYPNPGKGLFNIDGSGLTGHSTIQVVNLQGQMIHSETADLLQGNFHKVIDLSAIPAGIYFIRLVNESDVIIKKIVIQ